MRIPPKQPSDSGANEVARKGLRAAAEHPVSTTGPDLEEPAKAPRTYELPEGFEEQVVAIIANFPKGINERLLFYELFNFNMADATEERRETYFARLRSLIDSGVIEGFMTVESLKRLRLPGASSLILSDDAIDNKEGTIERLLPEDFEEQVVAILERFPKGISAPRLFYELFGMHIFEVEKVHREDFNVEINCLAHGGVIQRKKFEDTKWLVLPEPQLRHQPTQLSRFTEKPDNGYGIFRKDVEKENSLTRMMRDAGIRPAKPPLSGKPKRHGKKVRKDRI